MVERQPTAHVTGTRASGEVTSLAPAEIPLAARVLARAFRDNPGMLTILPGKSAEARQRALERCFPSFLSSMFRYGCVEAVRHEGEIVGVSMAYAPRTFPPPVFATLIQAPGPLRAGLLTAWRMLRADHAMHRLHPRFPHWYVWWIGIDPDHQGRGYGGALMRSSCRKADQDGVACYLETDKPSSVGFYESFGYGVHAHTLLPGALKLWLMLRPIT